MTFFLISIALVERNYAIYDKELLVIIRYFKEWSPELRSLGEDSILVLIDYKALEYFILIKKLTR
jgi:RNase H-like domain found in reverse transcriptase